MKKILLGTQELRSSINTSSIKRGRWLSLAGAAALCLAAACGDDDGDDGGAGGSAGTAGGAGTGGSAGSAGSAGTGGSAGSAGTAGMGGGGMGGGGMGGMGLTGTIDVLSDDADLLLVPTTAAIREDDVFVALAQFAELTQFGGDDTPETFTVISLPLAGGAPGDSVELPGDDFYPEGVTAADDGTLYVGSVTTGAIVSVEPDSTTAEVFVAAGAVAERGVVGLTVDEDRELLWFCDSSPVAATPGGALVGVALEDGDEVVRHELPDVVSAGGADAGADAGAGVVASFCNDVIVLDNDDLLVTESASGRIFRVPAADAMTANSAEIWLEAPELAPPAPGGFGVNGLDVVGDRLIVANGGLFAIDLDEPEGSVEAISLTLDGDAETLCGPDGLAAVPNTNDELIVVENGFCAAAAPRVIRVELAL